MTKGQYTMSLTVTIPSLTATTGAKNADIAYDADDIATYNSAGPLTLPDGSGNESRYRQTVSPAGENHTVAFKTRLLKGGRRSCTVTLDAVVKTTSTLTDTVKYEPITVYVGWNNPATLQDSSLVRLAISNAIGHVLGAFNASTGLPVGTAISKLLNGVSEIY
jgi:hypothetical protein